MDVIFHRENQPAVEAVETEDEDADGQNPKMRRRISYTKEQKLGAISYATTTWKVQKDGSSKLVSKRAAAKNLGITTAMIWQWWNSKTEIESSLKGARKNRLNNVPCQEPEMKTRLTELFREARSKGKKIANRWFMHYAKSICGQLHLH